MRGSSVVTHERDSTADVEPGYRAGRLAAVSGLFRHFFDRRNRGRVRLYGLLIIVVVVTAAVVAWFTPVLAVRTVRIDGLAAVPEEQVRELVRIPPNLSILRVDTDAVARRVASIPKVRSVRVQRVFPSTVRVTVWERTPVLFFDAPDGPHLLDGDGVEFAVEPPPPGVAKLVTDHAGSADPVTAAAVSIVDALPRDLAGQVEEVAARSVSDVSLRLTDRRTVLWGGTNDAERKAAVVVPLLTQPGTVFDVSSPNLVTVK